VSATRFLTCLSTSLAVSAALVGGCASTEDPPVAVDSGTPLPGDAGIDAAVRECAIYDEGTQRACSCGATSGTQSCLGGAYTQCKCTTQIVAPPGTDLCKAGFYSGAFTGKYKPGAFGFGVVMSFFEVDIMGKGAGAFPALSFTLQKNETGAGEFQTFGVKNGCMVGSATAYFTDNPFVARIDGDLDCKTGKFTGTITGRYDLVSSGLKFDFTGPLSAQFTLPDNALNDGVWNVKEPPSLSGEPAGGGGGTWNAMWNADNPPAGEDPCAALTDLDAGAPATDAAVPIDAGSTGADAGRDGG